MLLKIVDAESTDRTTALLNSHAPNQFGEANRRESVPVTSTSHRPGHRISGTMNPSADFYEAAMPGRFTTMPVAFGIRFGR